MGRQFKLFCIAMILIALLFAFSACSDKSQEKLEKAELLLSEVSYELGKIARDCDFAQRQGDYDYMEEELGITQLRCEELQKKIDEARLFGFR